MVDFMVVPMPTWVRFTGEGGYPLECERVRRELTVGQDYAIVRLDVGRSSSTVTIADERGVPLGSYNTALFDFLAWGVMPDGD